MGVQFSKGQYLAGSGQNRPIEPGATIVIPITVGGPAAFIRASRPGEIVTLGEGSAMSSADLTAHFSGENRPLPAGEYHLSVATERVAYRDGNQEKVLWPRPPARKSVW
jgi:hypothetical protein